MRLSVFASSRRARKKCLRVRVFLNEVEVTKDCQVADSREGWVLLLARSAKGRPVFDIGRDVLKLRKHGRVRIVRARRRA